MRTVELYDLAVEVNSASAILSGLANQCSDKTDRLTDEYFKLALFGVSRLLDRISEDMDYLEEMELKKEGAANADV